MRLNSRSRIAKGLQYALALASFALAVVSTDAATLNLATRPLYAGGNVPPLVMIDMSKDHSLHQKAYNDYTDLDGNGTLEMTETTYNNGTDYYGYFDYWKCYTYDTSNERFTPAGNATTIKDSAGNDISSTHYCSDYSSAWSGNFLNWSSMTRIDEVRKILYGGARSTDTTSRTVLERAYLPMDAHAWAKYYGGTDLPKLTPYTQTDIAGDAGAGQSTMELTMSAGTIANITVTGLPNVAVGDQLQFTAKAGQTHVMTGWVSKVSSGPKVDIIVYADSFVTASDSGKKYTGWYIKNLTLGGLTICNVTPKDPNSSLSQLNTRAPEIRVVKGNYSTWGASEKWQCNWFDEHNNTQGSNSSNGNRAAISGINSSAENPSQTGRGIGRVSDSGKQGTYYARVEACKSVELLGKETCTAYTDGTTNSNNTIYKPTGLLQKYGATGQMKFGLMTGTYDKNISGGALRKNISTFNDEINTTTGQFSGAAGIVSNINKLRPYGYSYDDGSIAYTGTGSGQDNCNYQQTAIVPAGTQGASHDQGSPAPEGSCSTWGNPMSEIFVETLRYFAGLTATASFQQSNSGKDKALGLTTATWVTPLDNGAPYCSPLNTLVFNASVSSYDSDQLDTFAKLKGQPDISAWTDKVGDSTNGEGINGKAWFMGELNGTNSDTDKMCSGKTADKFSNVRGICPEGPSQLGTFQMAGAAYFARTNQIRVLTGVPTTDTTSLKVSTYGVQLASTTPKITVNVGTNVVNIVPSYILKPDSAKPSSGTLVDFKVISKDATSGKFYINWEDSTAGGDYDQDVWGILSYQVVGSSTITVSTQVVSASSANGQGFGYAMSGTTKDGPHFHSGIYNFNYSDPVSLQGFVAPTTKLNNTGGCSNCVAGDPKTTATYTVSGKTANQLDDPLRYAAKWGGFKDSNNNDRPDLVSEWDSLLADGSNGADGMPDNYFFANNPAALSASLERAFISILQTSSASSVATNSTSLNTGATIYQARFNGNDWSGQLLAYKVDTSGTIVYPNLWDAGALFGPNAGASRNILTYNATTGKGVPFDSSVPYLSALGTGATAIDRLNWLRGDKSKEGSGTGKLRARPTSVLGDIINSSPQYVAPPSAGWADTDYVKFVSDHKTRTPMVYLGANDGMLHAFDASNTENAAKERFAYVPAALSSKLSALTDPGYTHGYYVDGTPNIVDAKINGTWTSVLVGSLGAGGAGIYALDVTNPDSITEATAPSTVLWEFTNSVDADLGYTFGQPQIVKLAGATAGTSRWAAVFGNGYNSTAVNAAKATGQAYLYVVYLDHPSGPGVWKVNTDYLKIPTGAGTTSTPNGLSQVFPADVDAQADGTTDIIYAGDLLGNLWKFDMRNTDPAKWGTGSARTLLFQATSPDTGSPSQPITAPVEVIRNGVAGYVVLFGTGRYVDTADPSNMTTQSFYGIWDRDVSPATTVLRTSLVKQAITQEVSTTSDAYRITSSTAVTYSSSGSQGWYMDLVAPTGGNQGERVIYAPILRGTRVVFTTLVPSSDLCANGGYSWLMELGALSGARLAVTPFDVNHDGVFDSNDKVTVSNGGSNSTAVVSGTRTAVGIITTPTVLSGGSGGPGKETKISSATSGGLYSVTESAGRPLGRISWREIQK